MIYFNNDYSEGCHPRILERLVQSNFEQTPGYGVDAFCQKAASHIRRLCGKEDIYVHFLVGGTQTNLTVIAAALRAHQGVIGADTAHIHVHETGAVEAVGHKVLSLPSPDGKLRADQIDAVVVSHYMDEAAEHTVQPGMVYISNPTELGTLYSRAELEAISKICRKHGLYLFMDGARLGYGLTADGNDLELTDIARLCDVFYIGGTKVGALFGEAVVITDAALAKDFRYLMKQRGGMLAKGRLLGIQFDALFEDGLYFEIAKRANSMADQIRRTIQSLGYRFLVPGRTNQIFPILPDTLLESLAHRFSFSEQVRVDDTHRAVRFCTSWATTQENTDALCAELIHLSGKM